MGKQEDFVLRALEERDVRFVRLWFTDVLGFLKSVAVAPAELEGAFAEGIGFDGSAIEGFARVYEADMLAKPDPATFQILPWRGEGPATARMFCDIVMPDGSPVVRRPALRAQAHPGQGRGAGVHVLHAPRDRVLPVQGHARSAGVEPVPVDRSGYFDHTATADGSDFRREAITMLESMGISVEFSHHEGGPGQQEIDLRYADALSTADNIMTFRTVVREVALSQGIWATLHAQAVHRRTPAPACTPTSRCSRATSNAFFEAGRGVPAVQDRPPVHRRASSTTPREITRRDQPVGQLLQAADGRRRGAVVRLLGPQQPLGDGPGADVQAAQGPVDPDRAAHHRRRVQPLPRVRGDAGGRHEGHRGGLRAAAARPRTTCGRSPSGSARAWASSRCRKSLYEAIEIAESSELLAETLGEHVFDFFLRNKRAEWEDYRVQVSPFERDRMLPVL